MLALKLKEKTHKFDEHCLRMSHLLLTTHKEQRPTRVFFHVIK